MAKLPRSEHVDPIQVLTPSSIVAVSAGGVYTPNAADRVFCVDTETTIQINGTGATFTLPVGISLGIAEGQTYTLGSDVNLLIM